MSGLPGTEFLADKVSAIWFVVSRWIWDADMPGALVADEIVLRNPFTLVVAAMICKLVTEKVLTELPLSTLWRHTSKEWVSLAHNDFPGIVCEDWDW